MLDEVGQLLVQQVQVLQGACRQRGQLVQWQAPVLACRHPERRLQLHGRRAGAARPRLASTAMGVAAAVGGEAAGVKAHRAAGPTT